MKTILTRTREDLLELVSIPEMKNSVGGLNSRLDIAEDMMSKVKDTRIETTRLKHKEKND